MELTKRILIADDHVIVSKGLAYLIALNFPYCTVTEVRTIKEALSELSSTSFTHLILDLQLTDGNSMDYIPKMIEGNPLLCILIYSMASEDIFAKKILEMDTSGFLSKASAEKEIIQALKIFIEGGIYKSNRLKTLLNEPNNKIGENTFVKLSISELRVLDLILKGKRTKEISGELDLANQTIATFKSRIFKKLGTDNIFEIKKNAEINGVSFTY